MVHILDYKLSVLIAENKITVKKAGDLFDKLHSGNVDLVVRELSNMGVSVC